jgi:HD-GYP domain-containing protein (c-di-GMP phosphodiesterase class II)
MADPMIPIESKVIAVADAYDAMVGGVTDSEKRSYRKPITPKEAVAELRRCSGSQFDPLVVDAFVDALGQEATC